jgi:hypothetical protein
MELKVPSFWTFMLGSLFRVQNPKLAARIWAHYPASQTLWWQLQICSEGAARPEDMVARLRRLAELLEPRLMIDAAEKLVRKNNIRPKDYVSFEENVLKFVDNHGHWRW